MRSSPGSDYRDAKQEIGRSPRGRIELTEVGERNWWDFSAQVRGGAVRSAKNVAALGYSYHVAGVVYAGTYKQEFEIEDEAWEFARRLKGRAVIVQYNANKPSVSALSESSVDALNKLVNPAM